MSEAVDKARMYILFFIRVFVFGFHPMQEPFT